MADFVLSEQPPTIAEFIDLRTRAGCGTLDEATAARSLQAPAFVVSLRQEGDCWALRESSATASCSFS